MQKKILRKNLRLIITIFLLVLISGVSVYATASYMANQVAYKDGKTVNDALNELYRRSNPITIYSGAFDEVYYYENGEKKILVTTDSTGKANAILPSIDNLVIYSSVAKDINNTSNQYSKTITNSDRNKDIYLMPDGALFWYGNFCTNSVLGGTEFATEANGWTAVDQTLGTYTINEPSLDIRKLTAVSNNGKYASGIGTKQKIGSNYNTIHILTENVTGAWVSSYHEKNIMGYVTGKVGTLTANSNYSYELNPDNNYLHIHTDNNRVFQINAWWVE